MTATVTRLDTERDYDVVTLYDGGVDSQLIMGALSGRLENAQQTEFVPHNSR